MKKLYFFLMSLCLFTNVNAQIINIPDANFKKILLYAGTTTKIAKNLSGAYFKIDSNRNGEIEVSEALSVSYLDVHNGPGPLSDMTGIQSFSNLKELNCQFNNLTSLNLSGLTQLITLWCSFNKLTNLNLSGLTQLQELSCSNNQLTNLDLSGLTNLTTLICGYTQLTNLDLSGLTNLTTLICSDNQLSNLNLSGLTQLNLIYCENNQLTYLDLSGLAKLTTVCCYNNQLTNLNLSGLTELNSLECYYNQLTHLDLSGLTKLTNLECYNNQLTNLDLSGLTNVTNLQCNFNKLTDLNLSGLANLTNLGCDNNLLTHLDLSGLSQLKLFNCSGNLLTGLDLSGLTQLNDFICAGNLLTNLDLSGLTNLTTLIFSDNQLTNLDLSGLTNVGNLQCNNNKLTDLNLSGLTMLKYLFCNGNQNLESILIKDAIQLLGFDISECPNLNYICANEKVLTKVQSEIDKNNYTNCHVNSYCSFTPGGIFYTIQGTTKLDSGGNGCNENDAVYPNLKFSITDGTATDGFISNDSGNYSLTVQAGTHTVTPIIENPTYFTVSPANFQVSFPTVTSPYTQNFCIIPNGVHNDLEVAVIPLQAAVPGFDAKYKMVYKNKGNTVQSGSVSLGFDDSVLDLVLANPVVTSQTSNNLAWDFTNLHPFETREIVFTLNVNSPRDTPAVNNDDVLHYTTTVTSADTDETPLDNTFSLNQTVVDSYDPNDKTCLEGNIITPALIGQYVHYMIRFENEGTYHAQNIVVKDMIDLSKFDISTLVPTSASHSFVTRITNGNKVEFIFENINLPFDEDNNDGYVTFKIKTLPTLVVSDSFENEANIYFDYNFPILTNKATSTFQALSVQDFEFSNYFSLYPNPVNDVLKLSAKASIEISSISVYNNLGQMVIAVPNAETVSSIDVANLTSGTYFVKVNTNRGTSNTKFIKY